MSQPSAGTAASKKKQDERNSKIIREIAALPDNRFCFECGQRGPTYVNITQGSFCCTTCSGLLRGLNPPHRVKSISMGTFSNEEIEKIRSTGNAENQKIWMGMYNGTLPKFSSRDDQQTFLSKKYEKRAWYVSPQELEQQERLLSAARERSSQGTASVTSDASSYPPSDIPSDPFCDAFAITRDQATSAQDPPMSPPAQLAPPPPLFATPSHDAHVVIQQQPSPRAADPFSPMHTSRPVPSKTADPFADFDNLFGGMALQNSKSTGNMVPQPAPTVPRSHTITAPATPAQMFQPQQLVAPKPPPRPVIAAPAVDKYSALAELDQIFHRSATPPQQPMQQQPSTSTWANFSNGTPAVNGVATANPFGTPTPMMAASSMMQPMQQVQTCNVTASEAWANPFTAANPFGAPPSNGVPDWMQRPGVATASNPFVSLPKSSTIGAFGDLSARPNLQQVHPMGQPVPYQADYSQQAFAQANPFASCNNISNGMNGVPSSYGQAGYQPNKPISNGTQNGAVNWNPFI